MGFIIIWIKSFFISLPPEYEYAKYYLWYILFTSFTWYSVYHYHYLISTVFALYVFHKGIEAKEKRRLVKKVINRLIRKEKSENIINLE